MSMLQRHTTYKTYTKYLPHNVKNERKNKKNILKTKIPEHSLTSTVQKTISRVSPRIT